MITFSYSRIYAGHKADNCSRFQVSYGPEYVFIYDHILLDHGMDLRSYWGPLVQYNQQAVEASHALHKRVIATASPRGGGRTGVEGLTHTLAGALLQHYSSLIHIRYSPRRAVSTIPEQEKISNMASSSTYSPQPPLLTPPQHQGLSVKRQYHKKIQDSIQEEFLYLQNVFAGET